MDEKSAHHECPNKRRAGACMRSVCSPCITFNNKSRSARGGRMTSCASSTPQRRRRFILEQVWWNGVLAVWLRLCGRILTGVPSTADRNGSSRSLPIGINGRIITMPTLLVRDGLHVIVMATHTSSIMSGKDRTHHLPN